FRGQAVRQGWNSHAALGVLPTGHGHRPVVEETKGDVHPGGHTGPQRLAPGVKVGTVTNVLEDMMRLRERRRAYPRHPLPAHLGQIAGMPGRLLDHPAHAMAPNTTTDDVPFQGACRAVMRTAGAVVGLARQKRLIVPRAYGLQDRQASRNTWCLARL